MVYRWLGQFGVDTDNEEKRQATVDRHRAKREALREAALDAALHHAIKSVEADTSADAQRHAVAFGIFDDKLNRTAGGPAAPFTLTAELLESEIARLEEELGKAPRSARQVEAEREMERVLEEHRRGREAEATIEGRVPPPAPWTFGRGQGPNGDNAA